MKKIFKVLLVLIVCLMFASCKKPLEEVENDYEEISIKEYKEKKGESTFNVGSAVIKIKSDIANQEVLVDDILVFTTSYPFLLLDDYVLRYGESFIITANDKSFVYLYDSTSKSMSDYSLFSKYNLVTTKYIVSKDSLVFETSARNDQEIFVDSMQSVLINNCELYNKYKDNYVEATIEMKYLGDGKFDDYKIIKSKKVSDYPEYNSLCE